MDNLQSQLNTLKEHVMSAIVNLTDQRCEVDMQGLQIRQSFSYYESEVYHIDKIIINPEKGSVEIELYEYSDLINLNDFSVDDQIEIFRELNRLFTNPKYGHRINY